MYRYDFKNMPYVCLAQNTARAYVKDCLDGIIKGLAFDGAFIFLYLFID